MCTNQRWIVNKVTKQRVLIRCGKCPACLQAKANARTLRINLQSKFSVPSGYITFFVTLGYDNDNIPFILRSQYTEFINKERPSLPVYRFVNNGISKGKKKSDKKYSRRHIYGLKRPLHIAKQIDEFENYQLHTNDELFESKCDTFVDKFKLQYYSHEIKEDTLPELRTVYWQDGKRKYNFIYERVGVLYYKDIQDFIKRLRIYLERKYGIKDKFHFFSCGEYGPTSKRPHYHILFHIPADIFTYFKAAVIDSWKYENLHDPKKQERQLKIADGVANYVSSYVNCDSSFPAFFKEFRPFRPSHNYSLGYGMVSNFCKLPTLLEMSRRHKFTYSRTISIGGVKSVVDLPIPTYVINRYFPKFKGYSRLTSYEIYELIRDCSKFCFYKKTLDLNDDDVHRISIMFRNSYIRYCELLDIPLNDYSLDSYAFDYVRTWTTYYSFLNLLGYEEINSFSGFLYRFVNWYEMKDVHDLVKFSLPYVINPIDDVNKYPDTVFKDSFLESEYLGYDKMKKVKNNLYSINSNI